MKAYFETELGKLYLGDCLEIMNYSIHEKSVDAVITDPPFAFTGGVSNGTSACVSDQFFRHWWSSICDGLSRVLKPEASGFIWCDWKTAKIVSDGFEPKHQTFDFFRISQMLYHYRKMGGMGKPFRSSIDMIAYMRGPKHRNPPIPSTENCIQSYWYYGKHEYHPAEKSPDMCEMFLNWCSRPGEIVVDPFFGSGVVGVTCEKLGRQWIGCEVDEKYAETAAKRIEKEMSQVEIEWMANNHLQPDFNPRGEVGCLN